MDRLFIMVEGSDDLRFFQKIIKPRIQSLYYNVSFWMYAEKKKAKIRAFIKSINSMGAEYVFVSDINKCSAPGVRIKKLKKAHPSIDVNRIGVVIKEIESWYIAGVSKGHWKKLGINASFTPDTERISKEDFEKLCCDQKTRTEVFIEMLNTFDFQLALARNNSLQVFNQKFLR